MRENQFVITLPLPGASVAGAGVLQIPVMFPTRVLRVRHALSTAPTGGNHIIDVHKATEASPAGTTIFTDQDDRPTVVAGNNLGNEAEPDSDAAVFGDGDLLVVDVDLVGVTVAGSNLVVSFDCEKI